MENNLALIPNGVRVKLLLRHSIRWGVEGVPINYKGEAIKIEAGHNWGLTREGKIMAEAFGRGLREHFSLTRLASSESHRCKESIEHIQKGYGSSIETSAHKILTAMWIADSKTWHKSYEAHNRDMKAILQKMLDREQIEGVYPVEKSVALLLEYMGLCGEAEKIDSKNCQKFDKEKSRQVIESTIHNKKDSKNELDIFVSHDAFIMLLLCFVLRKRLSEIEWVYMLEGVFLWNENNILCLAWRGEKFEISNLALQNLARQNLGVEERI